MIGKQLAHNVRKYGEDEMKESIKYHCIACDIDWTDVTYKEGNAPTCPLCDTPIDSMNRELN